MQKVKLPREVVDALNRAKDAHPTWNAHDLFYIIINPSGFCQYKDDIDIGFIQKWAYRCHELTLAKALLNGYEVEETPEDKVREYFRHHYEFGNNTTNGPYGHLEDRIKYETVLTVLDMLEIKIKGVNDHE